ncbi:MAG: hypothetical protein K9J28_05055 [Sulfuritalea sp.]|nr:hypothetical protein [Sulfuritalea sp.]
MNKKQILIIGDSHTDAIKRALKHFYVDQVEIKAYRYSKLKNGEKIGDMTPEEILKLASTLSSEDLFVSTIGGNQHQVVSLMQHPIPFDIFSPSGVGDCKSSIHIIPYVTLFDFFESGIRFGDWARLSKVCNIAQCRVCHIVPPPPKEDKEHILKRHETHFVKAGLAEKGVTSAALRLKIWLLQVEVLKKLAKEYDVQLVMPPNESLDPNGFLSNEYYANDATHANSAYGELVLQKLVKLCMANGL